MRSAFKDPNQAEAFLRKGFTTFPLLSSEDVAFVSNIYHRTNSTNNKLLQPQFYGVNYSLGTLSAEENKNIMAPIEKMLNERLPEHFSDYEIMGCVFISKPPHTPTTFLYHQDWSYTNEQSFAFATCWVPLCDTHRENGCMSVIEGSHLSFESYRSDSLNSARIPFESIPEELRSDVLQQRGSCLAFHQAAFHGSYPNVSDQNRPVLAFVVKPREAPIVQYIADNGKILAYEMSLNAFDNMLNQIPSGRIPAEAVCVETIYHIPALPSARDIISQWRIHHPSHRLLADPEQHLSFIKQGYLKLKNIISPEAIARLRDLYHANFVTPDHMYVTHHDVTDVAKNKVMSDHIFDLLGDFFRDLFIDHQRLLSHFAAKGKGPNGQFNFHQDWSIVEEEIYGVMHCWIPLQDTNYTNGTLSVLPASHLLFHNYRSGSSPIRFSSMQAYDNNILSIPARAGDVILYHPALFHGSSANQTDTERLAAVAAISHPSASRVYFHQEDGVISEYELTDQDLFGRLDDLAKGKIPLGNKIKTVPYRVLTIDDAAIISRLNEYLSEAKKFADAEI